MDKINRAILFGGKAIVTAFDTRQLVQCAIDKHQTSPLSSEILGKVLSMAAFISSGFKGQGQRLSITINGGGEAGKIVVAADCGAKVRGYIQNPNLIAQSLNRSEVGRAVGKDGTMTIVKDFGLKEPYVGTSELINGNIDEDFMYYFTVSEQLPSAISLGVGVEGDKCVCAGGVIVQPMPNCDEHMIFVLQDIVKNFVNIKDLLKQKSPYEIIDENFGHFEIKHLSEVEPTYQCKCSQEKIAQLVKSLGRKEADEVIAEQGKIEVFCEFCNTFYNFDKADVADIFDKN